MERQRNAIVYVADQGIGIPRAEQGKLFQRFYRVDSSLRRSTQGAGLGLYLCKSIVEAHGGRIWLRSEPGKGTTVFFTLPLAKVRDDERDDIKRINLGGRRRISHAPVRAHEP